MARASESIELSPRIERLCWTVFATMLLGGLLLYSAVLGAVHVAHLPTQPAETTTIVIFVPANVGQSGVYPVQLPVAVRSQIAEGSDVAAN